MVERLTFVGTQLVVSAFCVCILCRVTKAQNLMRTQQVVSLRNFAEMIKKPPHCELQCGGLGKYKIRAGRLLANQFAWPDVAQLFQGAQLDLADALAGHVQANAYFFQGAGVTIVQAEAHAQHFFFAPG